jgi:hypothetical protein
MNIDHAQVMAHMCRMVKEAQGDPTAQATSHQPIGANTGALIGAGIGAAGLPLIDYLRGRKSRMGVDALAGGLAGGAMGYGAGYMNENGWDLDALTKRVANGEYRGRSREQDMNAIDAAKLEAPGMRVLSNISDPTASGVAGGLGGMYVGGRGGKAIGGKWGGRLGAGALGLGGYFFGNNIQRAATGNLR